MSKNEVVKKIYGTKRSKQGTEYRTQQNEKLQDFPH
jgi:hypothetical protein